MLEKILNKKVRVGVALADVQISRTMATKYYEGTVVAYDEDFIMFDDGSMINIKYIQTIQMIK